MILHSLLPQDTRIAELTSGFALIFVSMVFFFGGTPSDSLLSIHHEYFWALITSIFGCLQLTSVTVCEKLEHLRFILAWLSGTFWIWVSTEHGFNHVHLPDIATFVLGVANLYAFVVNLLLIKQSWK